MQGPVVVVVGLVHGTAIAARRRRCVVAMRSVVAVKMRARRAPTRLIVPGRVGVGADELGQDEGNRGHD